MTVKASRTFHGVAVSDPFQWLERTDDARVQAWLRGQGRRTAEFLDRCLERAWCHEYLASHHAAVAPAWNCVRGPRRFHLARSPGSEQPHLCVTAADGVRRTLFDPNPDRQSISPHHASVSSAGSYVAFTLADTGAVTARMRVCDGTTGAIIDACQETTAAPLFAWLPDESGFFYTLFRRLFVQDDGADSRPDGLYRHVLGTDWRDDLRVCAVEDDAARAAFAAVPDIADGLLVGMHEFGSRSTRFSLRTLSDPVAPGVEVLGPGYNEFLGGGHGRLYFHTRTYAPRGSIVVIDPGDLGPARWHTLVEEPERIIAQPDRFPGPAKCAVGPDGLLVCFVEHAHDALRFYSHDGALLDRIDLPHLCSVDAVQSEGDTFRIVTQSFLEPRIEYRYDPTTRRLQETTRIAPGQFDFERYCLRQVFYPSPDGTSVPMYLLHDKELPLHGNHPTLLYGYGGFGQSITPEYMPEAALWLELGGVYAVANIRGGGEYGQDWHAAGAGSNKQNSFDDFYAAAEYLLAQGITGTGMLCARGISNGGLLTAVSANQRPDLFAAVVSEMPLTDMLWLGETAAGRALGAEYGNPCESRRAFEVLRAYSPVHNTHGDGPAQMVIVAEKDASAPPGQAYKYVAARQAALAEAGRDTPVLLQVVEAEGHGGWREESTRATLGDEIAFLWHVVHHCARAPDLAAVAVPMRDGVRLSANVWLPARTARSPAVLLRTPYGNSAEDFVRYGLQDYLHAGFAVVIQSVRGRGDSQGDFGFFFVEGKDGYDSIEWIASQPWCDGQVAMDGASYLGTVQWLAARERPPHLKCILPFAAAGDWFHEIPYIGGALHVDWVFSWLGRMAGLAFEFDSTTDINLERFRPLAAAEHTMGKSLPLYRDILAHPTPDAFWQPLMWNACDFARIDIPVLTATGWFDGDQAGALHYWRGLQQHGRAFASAHLVIGPWRHAECYLGGHPRVGLFESGIESVLPMRRLRVEFLRRHLRGETQPDQARVRLFVTGSRCWREYDRYPPPEVRHRPWYLCADSPANGLHGGGTLSEERPHGEADRFDYDPLNPVPYRQGAEDHADIERRSDVLVYTSGELQQPVTVIGAVELVLHAASDAPDTDFTAKLLDVSPDGSAVSLTHVGGILRARYRNGLRRPEELTPGQPYELRIRLTHVGHTFLRAHRIRLEVSSSCFPLADPNTNTGGDFATDTAPRMARQLVLHDPEHPSRLLLPQLADCCGTPSASSPGESP